MALTNPLPFDARALAYLSESDVLDGLSPFDYLDPAHCRPGHGHAGAFLDAQTKAQGYEALTVADLHHWHELITAERGGTVPAQAPSPALQRWLDELNKRLEPLVGAPYVSEVQVVALLGELGQRFAGLGAFTEAQGRLERLLLTYMATFCDFPIMVFRSAEQAAYRAAHRSVGAMQAYLAGKIREATKMLNGLTAERTESYGPTDRYQDASGASIQVEWHDLVRAAAEWEKAAAAET